MVQMTSSNAEEADSNPGDDGSDSPSADLEFELSAEQMLHDYDDEDTLAEEEASGEADVDELDDLTREGEMPLEELLARYSSCPQPAVKSDDTTSGTQNKVVSSSSDGVRAGPAPSDAAAAVTTAAYGAEEDFSDYDEEEDDDEDAMYEEADADGTIEDDEEESNFNALRFSLLYEESAAADPDYDLGADLVHAPSWKKEIRLGADYQAAVPTSLQPYDDTPAYENQDRLLWRPLAGAGAAAATANYCARIQALRCVAGSEESRRRHPVPDDEAALYMLQQCDHAVEEALRRAQLMAGPESVPAECDAGSAASSLSLWSEEETTAFEQGVLRHGKDFHAIRTARVQTRSVSELVHFYYLWKRTERHDALMRRCGRDKRRCGLHQGYADYMHGLAREQDLIAENYLLNDRLPPASAISSSTGTSLAPPAAPSCSVVASLGAAANADAVTSSGSATVTSAGCSSSVGSGVSSSSDGQVAFTTSVLSSHSSTVVTS